jgi:hypothetical protein
VILHHGEIVAERYAPGVTPATPLQGWSMTKSVINALLGILVRDGKLDIRAPAPIVEWSAHDDPRRSITIDQMLRMVSGLGCGQSLHFGWWTIFDADAQMEFDRPDQAAFAAHAGLRAEPGSEWRYTNCNFVLLSRIIRDAAGGDAESTHQFLERELFAPLASNMPRSNTTVRARRSEQSIFGPAHAIGHVSACSICAMAYRPAGNGSCPRIGLSIPHG